MKTVFRSFSRDEVIALAARHDSDEAIQHTLAELLYLREQRDRLQTRCTELVEQHRGTVTLRWKRCGAHDLPIPAQVNPGDAGLDLPVIVDSGTSPNAAYSLDWRGEPTLTVYGELLIVFRTGWAVEIPSGYYGQIVVRSSIGKAGWDIESSGVIDSSYRGEIMMPMVYRGIESTTVEHGQRMAQMLILPVPRIECIEVDKLSDSARGTGGFGSTGQ